MITPYSEEVEEFFDFMDRDFNGRLTIEEFMGEEILQEYVQEWGWVCQ
jgi:hypothetical protein